MTRVLAIFFLVSVLVLAFGSGVNAQPLLTCDVFPCNLYETTNNDPAGPATETGPEIMLPGIIAVGPGAAGGPTTSDQFIVLLESGTADHLISNWSDVIKITTPTLDGDGFTQIASFEVDEQYIGVFQNQVVHCPTLFGP